MPLQDLADGSARVTHVSPFDYATALASPRRSVIHCDCSRHTSFRRMNKPSPQRASRSIGNMTQIAAGALGCRKCCPQSADQFVVEGEISKLETGLRQLLSEDQRQRPRRATF